ncbi:hypothetical protein SKAU_G00240090 [Synaphobranchus kaupii]|uniref:Uncharacterized protein n=1 Tax=Synaphobranchus kaupii TaxID=118154 RepID=A0A9Q1F7H3_SYNKA|nr:hypothetical protein SKAU_G00240090 [Synaphobranchus kaupii]
MDQASRTTTLDRGPGTLFNKSRSLSPTSNEEHSQSNCRRALVWYREPGALAARSLSRLRSKAAIRLRETRRRTRIVK